jgi:hypothetical protein
VSHYTDSAIPAHFTVLHTPHIYADASIQFRERKS